MDSESEAQQGIGLSEDEKVVQEGGEGNKMSVDEQGAKGEGNTMSEDEKEFQEEETVEGGVLEEQEKVEGGEDLGEADEGKENSDEVDEGLETETEISPGEFSADKGLSIDEEESSDGSEFFECLINNEEIADSLRERIFLYLFNYAYTSVSPPTKLALRKIIGSWISKDSSDTSCTEEEEKYLESTESDEFTVETKPKEVQKDKQLQYEIVKTTDEAVQYEEQIEEEELCEGVKEKPKSPQLDPEVLEYLHRKLSAKPKRSLFEDKEDELENMDDELENMDDDESLYKKLDDKLLTSLMTKVFYEAHERNTKFTESEEKETIHESESDHIKSDVKAKLKETMPAKKEVDPEYEHPLMRVYIHHGPYYRDTIIEHSPMRIKGLVERLKALGISVAEKKWSHVDRLGIKIAGRFVFYCKVTELEFDGEGFDDTSDLAFRTIKDTLRRVKRCIKERSHLRPSIYSDELEDNPSHYDFKYGISYLRLGSSEGDAPIFRRIGKKIQQFDG